MKQYLALCKRIVREGYWVENKRTGKRCLTVINADLEYDCKNMHLPILTTKKLAWKPAIAEMLGYLRGYTSAAEFRAIGCNTWNMNSNENEAWLKNPHRKGKDDMGEAYRFRSSGYFIKPIKVTKTKPKDTVTRVSDEVVPDLKINKHDLVGKVFESNNYGSFIVTKEYEKSDCRELVFNIQFVVTGFEKKGIRKAEILRGEVRDLYYPSYMGVGRMGTVSNLDSSLVNLLLPVWQNMLGRCYEKSGSRRRWYSAKGVFVDERWLVFENFVKDFEQIDNWHLKKVFPSDYSLDKDYTGANYYSAATCRWATKTEQTMNSKSTRAFIATNITTGEREITKGAIPFVKRHGLSLECSNKISRHAVGETITYKNWSFELLPSEGVCYVEVDQFKSIYAWLKLGIDNRKLIMSARLPHSEQRTCLPACMHTHTFSILHNSLYLTSYQRSDDIPLGHGFNQVQVAWLLMVMAQITGLKPAKAFHKVVNAHIYDNQLETLQNVQMKREPYRSPKLKINPKIKTLEDLETWVTVDDFELIGYKHHPAIKYEFSV